MNPTFAFGCRPKRNGSMPLEADHTGERVRVQRQQRPRRGGVVRPALDASPPAFSAAAWVARRLAARAPSGSPQTTPDTHASGGGQGAEPARACMTCPATCGNGVRMSAPTSPRCRPTAAHTSARGPSAGCVADAITTGICIAECSGGTALRRTRTTAASAFASSSRREGPQPEWAPSWR